MASTSAGRLDVAVNAVGVIAFLSWLFGIGLNVSLSTLTDAVVWGARRRMRL